MPIWTFECPVCGSEKDVVLKFADRDRHSEPCSACEARLKVPQQPHAGVTPSIGWLRWRGRVEGGQAHRPDGAYQFSLNDSHGRKVMSHRPARGH